HEPAPLGTDALPALSHADPHVREEDHRLTHRAPAPHARRHARARGAGPRLERDPLANGQPDESLSCHQPASMPIRPKRGRTSHTPHPPWPRSVTGSRTNL